MACWLIIYFHTGAGTGMCLNFVWLRQGDTIILLYSQTTIEQNEQEKQKKAILNHNKAHTNHFRIFTNVNKIRNKQLVFIKHIEFCVRELALKPNTLCRMT